MMALPLLVLMGVGHFLPWKRAGRFVFLKPLSIIAALTLLAVLVVKIDGVMPLIWFGVSVWLMVSSLAIAWYARKTFSIKTLSMILGHFGVGLCVIGMMGSMLWRIEDIRVVRPQDSFTIGRHTIEFEGVRDVFGPNYGAYEASIKLDSKTIHPQKRWYPVSDSETTEAAIHLTFLDDVYVVLGERDTKAGDDAWVLRTSVHPFVSTLWGGFFIIVLSGVFMLVYSVRKVKP
jgi:cytochrome c-type biogenesis protein CcmF